MKLKIAGPNGESAEELLARSATKGDGVNYRKLCCRKRASHARVLTRRLGGDYIAVCLPQVRVRGSHRLSSAGVAGRDEGSNDAWPMRASHDGGESRTIDW